MSSIAIVRERVLTLAPWGTGDTSQTVGALRVRGECCGKALQPAVDDAMTCPFESTLAPVKHCAVAALPL